MARRTITYAIRLAVEGGGQVKAELVSVGQSGEQSLKRIESAGERASGGLKGLGRQAELLRAGIRTLGGALIGAATVGGLMLRSKPEGNDKDQAFARVKAIEQRLVRIRELLAEQSAPR
jgi:hypothetical protein